MDGLHYSACPSFLIKLFFQFSDAGDYISKFRIMIRELSSDFLLN